MEMTPLRTLISLYISFAHLSDDVLAKEEMNSILKKIIEWVPEENPDTVTKTFKEVYAQYHTFDSYQDWIKILKESVSSVRKMFDDKEKFLTVLNDLVEISMSDKKFKDTERQMINICAEKWGVDFKV